MSSTHYDANYATSRKRRIRVTPFVLKAGSVALKTAARAGSKPFRIINGFAWGFVERKVAQEFLSQAGNVAGELKRADGRYVFSDSELAKFRGNLAALYKQYTSPFAAPTFFRDTKNKAKAQNVERFWQILENHVQPAMQEKPENLFKRVAWQRIEKRVNRPDTLLAKTMGSAIGFASVAGPVMAMQILAPAMADKARNIGADIVYSGVDAARQIAHNLQSNAADAPAPVYVEAEGNWGTDFGNAAPEAAAPEIAPEVMQVPVAGHANSTQLQRALSVFNQYVHAPKQKNAPVQENDRMTSLVGMKYAVMNNHDDLTGSLRDVSLALLFALSVSMARIESSFTPTAVVAGENPDRPAGLKQMNGPEFFVMLAMHMPKTKMPDSASPAMQRIAEARARTINNYIAVHQADLLRSHAQHTARYNSGTLPKDYVPAARLSREQKRQRALSYFLIDSREMRGAYDAATAQDKQTIRNARLNVERISFNGEQTSVGAYLSATMALHLADETRVPQHIINLYGREAAVYIGHQRGQGALSNLVRDHDAIAAAGNSRNLRLRAISRYHTNSFGQAGSNPGIYFRPNVARTRENMRLPSQVFTAVRDEHFGKLPDAARALASVWLVPNSDVTLAMNGTKLDVVARDDNAPRPVYAGGTQRRPTSASAPAARPS